MYEIIFTNQFKHAVKRCAKRGLDVNKIAVIVDILKIDGTLPQQYKPHKLSNYSGGSVWECHIKPDWLLVWEQNDSQLTLLMLNTGSHSDLF